MTEPAFLGGSPTETMVVNRGLGRFKSISCFNSRNCNGRTIGLVTAAIALVAFGVLAILTSQKTFGESFMKSVGGADVALGVGIASGALALFALACAKYCKKRQFKIRILEST